MCAPAAAADFQLELRLHLFWVALAEVHLAVRRWHLSPVSLQIILGVVVEYGNDDDDNGDIVAVVVSAAPAAAAADGVPCSLSNRLLELNLEVTSR